MDSTSSVFASGVSLGSNLFSEYQAPAEKAKKAPEKKKGGSVGLLERFSVNVGPYAVFGTAQYPEEVGGRIKITNLNGEKTAYEDVMNDDWSEIGLVAGVGFKVHDLVTVGYDWYWPGLGKTRVGEYRYHWSDPSHEISDTTEGEIEYIKREFPSGIHNPYVKVNMPFLPFAYAKAGYRFGDVKFVQGKETYGEEHDARTIFSSDLQGYDASVGFMYPLSLVDVGGEIGYVDMRGEGIRYQAGIIQVRISTSSDWGSAK